MTRELKIALLVGFCLVLVVSVLIADHLSAARTATLADATGESAPLVEDPLAAVPEAAPGAAVMPGPLAGTQPAPGAQDGTSLAAARQDPNLWNLGQGTDAYAMQGAMELTPGGAAGGTPAGAPGQDSPYVLVQGAGSTSGQEQAGGTDDRSSLVRAVEDVGARIANGELHLPAAAQVETQDLTRIEPVIVEPKPMAPERTYTVKSGDNLYKIAKSIYGSGEKWRTLADANKDKIARNGNLKVGAVLRVPDAAKAPGSARTARAEGAAAPSVGRSEGTTYVVKTGDSLGEIAQRTLGTTKRMPEILALNRKTLSNPDAIRVGMTLKIPAR